MDASVEERIRARAHAIWEEEGRPEGREVEHWLQAAEEVARAEGVRIEPAAEAPGAAGDLPASDPVPFSPARTGP